MFKGKNIYLRLFEPEDFEKTYAWRNDFALQKMTCGPIRFVSKEIEKNWVASKATSNNRDIYLAICLNETDEMIGYISVNDIDYINRSCVGGGVLIGNKDYQDGITYLEATLLLVNYVFEQLNMNRYEAECLDSHLMSVASLISMNYQQEGMKRKAVYKNGKYHDVIMFSLLREEYYEHLNNGEYEIPCILKKIVKYAKQNKSTV